MSMLGSRARLVLSICQNTSHCSRTISLSAVSKIKELVEKKEGNTLTITCEVKPQEDKFLLKRSKTGACPLCEYGLEVKHTDVLIINQFLDSKGQLMKRNVTGLCLTQHKRMDYLVEMARAAGLLSKAYDTGEKIPKSKSWKKLNTYFDEDTIKFRYF